MEKVIQRMQEDMQLKGLSKNTQEVYLREVKYFAGYFEQSPDKLGTEEIRKYLLYVIKETAKSQITIKIAYSSIKFLYSVTLGRPWEIDRIPKIKYQKKLKSCLK